MRVSGCRLTLYVKHLLSLCIGLTQEFLIESELVYSSVVLDNVDVVFDLQLVLSCSYWKTLWRIGDETKVNEPSYFAKE